MHTEFDRNFGELGNRLALGHICVLSETMRWENGEL